MFFCQKLKILTTTKTIWFYILGRLHIVPVMVFGYYIGGKDSFFFLAYKFNLKLKSRTGEIEQGFKGIRQWPINRCTSPMMIHKFTSFVYYN